MQYLIPPMTSNNSPEPIVLTSTISFYNLGDLWHSFDGVSYQLYYSSMIPGYIEVDLGSVCLVSSFNFSCLVNWGVFVKSFRLWRSLDGIIYYEVFNSSGITSNDYTLSFVS